MHKTLIILILGILQGSLFAQQPTPEPAADVLWKDGKITPEQPFKAKVVAAGGLSPWSGETVVYLREDKPDEKEGGRFLAARISFATGKGIQYKELTQEEFDKVLKWETDTRFYNATVFITPVDVSQFVWSSPLGYLGKPMGDFDMVKRSYLELLKTRQPKPTDPATSK